VTRQDAARTPHQIKHRRHTCIHTYTHTCTHICTGDTPRRSTDSTPNQTSRDNDTDTSDIENSKTGIPVSGSSISRWGMGAVCFPVCGDVRGEKDAGDRQQEREYVIGMWGGDQNARNSDAKRKAVPLPAFNKPKVSLVCECLCVCMSN
jgi:hypothetical protein